jgi:hypothetical protein
MTDHIVEASPRRIARIAGAFYLLTFLTGTPALFIRSRLGISLGLIAGLCYVVVTVLFYYIFRPAWSLAKREARQKISFTMSAAVSKQTQQHAIADYIGGLDHSVPTECLCKRAERAECLASLLRGFALK